jgi:thiamine kinase-like enzyme
VKNPAQLLPPRVHATLDHVLGRRWREGQAALLHDGANLVVRVEWTAQTVVVRVPRADDATLQIDRRSELAALRIAARAGLSPEVVASELHSGLLVTRWIPGESLSAPEARTDAVIDGVAQLLRTLHGLAPSNAVRTIDFPALIRGYLDRLAAVGDPMTGQCGELRAAALHLLSEEGLSEEGVNPRVLCHCDPHHRNILRNGAFHLLDWEYAGLCHPLFDLAAYASYHDLDARATRRLLSAYSCNDGSCNDGSCNDGSCNDGDSEALARWRWLFDYLWLLWLRVSTGTAATGPPIDSASLLSRLCNLPASPRG